MPYKKNVEIGRGVMLRYGPDAGKLATIVNIVDLNRALVDGPAALTGVARQEIPLKWVMPTDIVVKIKLNISHKELAAVWKSEGVMDKWEQTSWAKKLRSRNARKTMTDYDRFAVMLARKERSAAVKAASA